MTMSFRRLLGAIALFSSLASAPVLAEEPIIIGDLNSYTALPAFSEPYRQGWTLAMEQINAAGGVLGREIEVISRDDGGKPADAVTSANELINREGADMLMGTLLSHVGLAVSDFAYRQNVIFLAAEPLTDALVWDQGNPVTFRLRPGTFAQAAMLAEEAAKLEVSRWATVAPNYEYGQSAVAAFKARLSELRPDVVFVDEQWPALFGIEAGTTVQALIASEPEAIFNVTFGGDLVKFVREGDQRGLFEGRAVVSLLTGEPEWMSPLGEEVPEGWIVTGYPVEAFDAPVHLIFKDAYEARFGEAPRMGSVVGYVSLMSLALAIHRAGSTETEAVAEALRGLEMMTPFGPILYRASDQQSTLGTFVGITQRIDGGGTIIDWRYLSGADYLPSEDEARALRPVE